MRKAFNEELLKAARQDERIHMILADIGYGEIEPFANEFPKRFINCGVAEQNMTGVACGVAMEGNIAITYSIANFPTLRCLEQIRNDVCYHDANVKIVIIGGGMAYGPLGVSHHSTEDLAIMRALPNMKVIAPCDINEARSAVWAMLKYNGPVYYRCGYKGEKDIHPGPVDFQIGKAIKIKDGIVMWQQICTTNSFNISELLSKYIDSLYDIKLAIDEHDEEKLLDFFGNARNYRESFVETSSGPIPQQFTIHVDIADKPGNLAKVATLLSDHSINIKNIGIVHNREYERGTLRIEFHSSQGKADARQVLTDNGYTIQSS